MTVQIEREIPVDVKKHLMQFPQKINSKSLLNVPRDEVGTWLLFADGAVTDSSISYVTFDIFKELSIEDVRLSKMTGSKKKLAEFFTTMEILCDKKLMKDIRQGLKEVNEGKLVSEQEFIEKHNLK
jgi:hypothetical protein